MIISIENKTNKDRVVTSIDQGKVNSYKIATDEIYEFECDENLAEIECDGSVIFIPTVIDAKNYVIIDDMEVKRSSKQIDILFVTLLIAFSVIAFIKIDANLIVTGLFLVIQALILTGIYRVLKSEQKGQVVFLEK